MGKLVTGNEKDMNTGEKVFLDALLSYSPDDWTVYHHREIFGREFDCAVLIPSVGFLVFEIKGWNSHTRLNVVGGDSVHLDYQNDVTIENPKKQSRAYRFNLIKYLKKHTGYSPLVFDMVAYPLLEYNYYKNQALDRISEEEFTILKEDLQTKERFLDKIYQAYSIAEKWNSKEDLTFNNYLSIRQLFEPDLNREQTEPFKQEDEDVGHHNQHYSLLTTVTDDLSDGEIRKILSQYKQGMKCYLFTSTDAACNRITNIFYTYLKDKTLIVDTCREIQSPRSFNAFNLQIMSLESFKGETSGLHIYDGSVTDEQEETFVALHDQTAFNFSQYALEHAPVNRNIIVTASAGTGKTYTMISRITYLCYMHQYTPATLRYAISMLTFTNEAANNMKEKLKQQFRNYYYLTNRKEFQGLLEAVDSMQISTIHRFALNTLQRYGAQLGYGKDTTIASGVYDRRNILEDIIDDYLTETLKADPDAFTKINVSFYELKQNLVTLITRLYSKNVDLASPDMLNFGTVEKDKSVVHDLVRSVITSSEKRFMEKLTEENVVHLNQLIVRFSQLASIMKDHREGFQKDYLLIDEFQDTDDAQIQALLSLQQLMGFKLFVVGDIKQCIYRFRGATTSAFRVLYHESGIKEWLLYSFNKNYRSDHRLLTFYNNLCTQWANNHKLIPYINERDRLTSNLEFSPVHNPIITQIHSAGLPDLYSKLAALISRWKADSVRPKGNGINENTQIAILVRTNWQVHEVKKNLAARGIFVNAKTGGKLYRTDPAVHLLKMTGALIFSSDPSYLAAFALTGYLDAKLDYCCLKEYSREGKTEYLISVLDAYFLSYSEGKYTFSQLVKMLRTEPAFRIIRLIIDICKPWQSTRYQKTESIRYRNNLDLIIEKVITRFSTDYLTINQLQKFLTIAVTTGAEEQEWSDADSGASTVICSTVHRAKGLEFGYVAVPFTKMDLGSVFTGVDVSVHNDRIGYSIPLPDIILRNSHYSQHIKSGEQKREETRLLYVAMTRAIREFAWISSGSSQESFTWDRLLRSV